MFSIVFRTKNKKFCTVKKEKKEKYYNKIFERVCKQPNLSIQNRCRMKKKTKIIHLWFFVFTVSI